MKVLIACEFSGVVREAFKAEGHDSWSCDLLDTEILGNHIKDDVLNHINDNWDLMVCHPPCTHLALSGARWFKNKRKEQNESIEFAKKLWNCNIPKIALENPISILSKYFGNPNQIIHPWMFGHNEVKTTCLWLKNLEPLTPTKLTNNNVERVHREAPSKDRWKNRSRFYSGIAEAMAKQWSDPNYKYSGIGRKVGRYFMFEKVV